MCSSSRATLAWSRRWDWISSRRPVSQEAEGAIESRRQIDHSTPRRGFPQLTRRPMDPRAAQFVRIDGPGRARGPSAFHQPRSGRSGTGASRPRGAEPPRTVFPGLDSRGSGSRNENPPPVRSMTVRHRGQWDSICGGTTDRLARREIVAEEPDPQEVPQPVSGLRLAKAEENHLLPPRLRRQRLRAAIEVVVPRCDEEEVGHAAGSIGTEGRRARCAGGRGASGGRGSGPARRMR